MDWNILERFKKQFHLAEKAANKMSQSNISFKMNYEEGKGIKTALNLPPEKEIARFATCLRPLADSTSPFFFKNIASMLIESGFAKMSELEKENLIKNIQIVAKGPLHIKMKGDSLSALDLYLLYAKGEYFSDDEAAVKKLKELILNPAFHQLVLFQFYSYSLDVYRICQYICYLTRQAEIIQGERKIIPKTSSQKAQCIYCLTRDAEFKHEEHVYPESLGNTEITLPPGCVCDNCNNGVLSDLDDFLVNHDIISFLRVLYVPYNPKSGKFLKARYQNMTIERTHPKKINFKMQSGAKKGFKVEDIGNGMHSIKVKTMGRVPFDPKHLGRSLYKIALGIVCWENGIETALDSKYDMARYYILGRSSFSNNLLISSECTPTGHIEGMHYILNPGTLFIMKIFGIAFVFNLEPEPIIQMNSEFEKFKFCCHSLSE